jgi:anti-sigma regulatory factor (Ser/Thr protein kinase)
MAGGTVITLRNDLGELAALNAALAAFGRAHAVAPGPLAELNLALEELVTNVVSYAYADGREHFIQVELTLDDGSLQARIEDDGRPFDPTAAGAPDLEASLEERPVGGLGMHLVRTLMDAVQYSRVRDRNVVTVTRRTGGPPRGPAGSGREGRT